VVAIGFDELQLLALGSGLANIFNPRSIPERFDGQGLWTHCLAVSWTARALAVKAGHRSPVEIQMAGLLHDLGKLVMAIHMPDDFEEIFRLVDEGLTHHEAEDWIGVPHTTVGRLLAAKWMLPEVHQMVINRHHDPESDGPHAEAVRLVALANDLTKELGFGAVWQGEEPDRAVMLEALNLDGPVLDTVADMATRTVPELLDSWHQAFFAEG
jgi:putative nucleotidyltransferase with HDIG domain